MAWKSSRNLYLHVEPSTSIDFDNQTYAKHEYKQPLEELLTYESKTNIFYDIDTLFITYQSLKRQYTKLWKKRELYVQEYLSSDTGITVISSSPTEISRLSRNINETETKFTQWMYKLFDKLCSTIETKHVHIPFMSVDDDDVVLPLITKNDLFKQKTAPIISQNSNHSSTSDTYENNIRPSLAQRKSNELPTRKSKKGKKRRKRKISTNDIYNVPLYNNHNNSLHLKRFSSSISLSTFSRVSSIKSLSSSKSVSSSASPSYRRSFGEIYDKEFVDCTANHYAGKLDVIDDCKPQTSSVYKASHRQHRMLQYYASQIYGKTETFESPFGCRPVLYCDWITSGKPLRCIEYYLSMQMMPLYADTHDNATISAMQSSAYEQEARSIILESLQAQSDQDVVLFCGNSAVDAIHKMAKILQQTFVESGEEYERDTFVVFVSVYESDNNIFIWKEIGCRVVVITECKSSDDAQNVLDLNVLETHLKYYSSDEQKERHKLLIGSFTAANAITGMVQPVDDVTELLHKYGALSFWDYEVGGPSMDILMTSWNNPQISKDAIFISTHRYLGGPQTPGILCAKKKLFQNTVPVVPGNGSLFMSYGHQNDEYEYLDNIEEREESGTPNLIGIVRASLCFMIKDYLSTQFIEHLENEHLIYFLSQLESVPNLIILGEAQMDRLPIISMMITHTKKQNGACETKYLHHNFIATLMNDLFGVQARGGAFYSDLYLMQCLNVSDQQMMKSMLQIKEHQNELERRGAYRINLHYTMNKEQLKYIVNAIQYVCINGWRFLPLYDINSSTGSFHYRSINLKSKWSKKQLRSLLEISFDEKTGKMTWDKKPPQMNNKLMFNSSVFIKDANDALKHLKQHWSLYCTGDQFEDNANIDDDSWFWTPSQLHEVLSR